ncbi:MAG: hypothetical protein ACHP9Z_17595, partial [Streptosporangiales bacterium]
MRRRILTPALVLALLLLAALTVSTPGGTAVARAGSPPPAATLIGHWAFDEGQGTTAADSSGAGH